MHIDNLDALNIIKYKLNVGNVPIDKSTNKCSFVVQNFTEIKDVICPIFIQFPLLTSKRLDFKDFYKAVQIKNRKNLSDADKERIISLYQKMVLILKEKYSKVFL